MSEPTALKMFEQAYYIGNYVGGVLLGANLTVYVLIIRGLFSRRDASDTLSKKRLHAFFATGLMVFLVIEAIIATVWGDAMWIIARDNVLAGGVPGWILTRENVWYAIVRVACSDALAALGDSFLLYRLYTIYGSRYAVIVLPSIIYVTGIGFAVVQVVSSTAGDFWQGNPVEWSRAYFSLTVSFNVLVTILILVRLHMASRAVRETTGRANSKVYETISAMIIESAAIYATFTITFLVIYSVGNPISVGFGNAAAKTQCLAQLLIILRVVNRTAWNHNVMTPASQSHGMQFAPGATSTSIATAQATQQSQRSTPNFTEAINKKAWNDSEGNMV